MSVEKLINRVRELTEQLVLTNSKLDQTNASLALVNMGAVDALTGTLKPLQQIQDGSQGFLSVETPAPVIRPIRRGTLLWYDDFEGTNLKWNPGGTVALVTTAGNVFHGNQACSMTTGAGVGQSSSIDLFLYLPPLRHVYFSAFFKLNPLTYNPDFRIGINYLFDAISGKVLIGCIKYVHASTKFQYKNSSGVWADVPGTFNPSLGASSWTSMMLDIDVVNLTYGKCLFMGKQIDMSSIPVASGYASQQYGYCDFMLDVDTQGAGASVAYVDDVIVSGVLNL